MPNSGSLHSMFACWRFSVKAPTYFRTTASHCALSRIRPVAPPRVVCLTVSACCRRTFVANLSFSLQTCLFSWRFDSLSCCCWFGSFFAAYHVARLLLSSRLAPPIATLDKAFNHFTVKGFYLICIQYVFANVCVRCCISYVDGHTSGSSRQLLGLRFYDLLKFPFIYNQELSVCLHISVCVYWYARVLIFGNTRAIRESAQMFCNYKQTYILYSRLECPYGRIIKKTTYKFKRLVEINRNFFYKIYIIYSLQKNQKTKIIFNLFTKWQLYQRTFLIRSSQILSQRLS